MAQITQLKCKIGQVGNVKFILDAEVIQSKLIWKYVK